MAIYIDVDDENQLDEDGRPVEKVGGVDIEKAKQKKMSVTIPQRRIQQFLDEYDCVVVNDFGDYYHLSEEERLRNNRYYEIFKEVKGYKNTYRKIEEYITVARKVLKCLDEVAENNMAMSPDKFKKAYLKGEIYVTGLRFPKYKGKDRKNISSQYLAEFILSDKDPSEFYEDNDTVYTTEELVELTENWFAPGELDAILSTPTEEESYFEEKIFDSEEDSAYGKNVVVPISGKEARQLLSSTTELMLSYKETVKREKQKDALQNGIGRYISDFTSDDIEEIAEYDQKSTFVNSDEIPKFKGNIMSTKDYNKYMAKLEEFEATHTRTLYHGKLKTEEEIREIELNTMLEENMWNIRKMWDNEKDLKKINKLNRLDKKKHKELKLKLIELDHRRNLRNGDKDADKKYKKEREKLLKDDKSSKKKKKKKKKNFESESDKKTKKMITKNQIDMADEIESFTSGILSNMGLDDEKDILDWRS